MLRAAFFALKRDAAPGIDRLRSQDYETDLDRRIEDLHARVSRLARRANACTGTVTVEILQLNKADICQIPGGFETTIAPLISLGNSKSRAARAGGGRNRRLTAPKRRHAPLCLHQGVPLCSLLAARRPSTPYAGAGGARNRAITDSISANICRDTATSAIWKVM